MDWREDRAARGAGHRQSGALMPINYVLGTSCIPSPFHPVPSSFVWEASSIHPLSRGLDILGIDLLVGSRLDICWIGFGGGPMCGSPTLPGIDNLTRIRRWMYFIAGSQHAWFHLWFKILIIFVPICNILLVYWYERESCPMIEGSFTEGRNFAELISRDSTSAAL